MIVEFLAYFFVFFGVFFEGELFLLSALVAAVSGKLNTILIVIVAFLAGFASDIMFFTLGRRKGLSWVNSKPKLKRILPKATLILQKNEILVLLTYRFMYGLRSIIPILFGIHKIGYPRFIFFAFLGNLLWVSVISYIGITFGSVILENLKHFEQVEKKIIIVLLILGVIFIAAFKRKELPQLFRNSISTN